MAYKTYGYPVYRSWTMTLTSYLMANGFEPIDEVTNEEQSRTATVFKISKEFLDVLNDYLRGNAYE